MTRDAGLAWLNALPGEETWRELRGYCTAAAWVEAIGAGRPLP